MQSTYQNIAPPDYAQPLLANENILFQIKCQPPFNFSHLQKFIFLLTLIPLLQQIYLYQNNFAPILQTLVVILLVNLTLNYGLQQRAKLQKFNPFIIGTENFLLIAHQNIALPVAWKYLNTPILHSKKPIGNIEIPFARKEYTAEVFKKFPQILYKRRLYLTQIENPALIAEICRTKIQQQAERF